VASCFAGSTPDRAVWVRASDGDIVSMRSWARHCTFTVLFSTQVYKWVPDKIEIKRKK